MGEPPLDVEAPLACPTVVSAGWSSHLVLWPEEWFPRFYRKRRNGWQWQTWGIDALEWVAFNHDLFQCKVVELPLETLRKLLELYRFALGEGHRVWGFLEFLHPIIQKDCPRVRLYRLFEGLVWEVAQGNSEGKCSLDT